MLFYFGLKYFHIYILYFNNEKLNTLLKNQIIVELAKFTQPETSASDFSGGDSDDYHPSQNESDSEAESVSDPESSDFEEPNAAAKKRYCPPVVPQTPQTGRSTRLNTRKQQDFVPESEEYFNHHINKKVF